MSSEILINVSPMETRVALMENGTLVEYMSESHKKKGYAGSIFSGRVSRILPGMQAAFVDIGLQKAAFLYVGDIKAQNENAPAIVMDNKDESESEDNMVTLSADKPTVKTPIQDLIVEGQDILVQVAKDPLGTKGARITTYISLPGRYVVYMPSVSHKGISRRIDDEEERERLTEIIDECCGEGEGVIVRTAAEGASREAILADISYLQKLYKKIQENFDQQKGPGLVYTELAVELRAVRDLLTEDVNRVIVDDKKAHEAVSDFISQFMPKLKDRVSYYSNSDTLFDRHQIDLEISRAIGRKVWLRSGGYIVIDEAEALVVIDVNTGSYVGKKDLEETILKTNLEAVKEVCQQLRLRNCGGIIIVDFIDMQKEENRQKVLESLKEQLKLDRAKTHVVSMSEIGLVEMTRKRIRPSLVKTLCEPCSYCDGKGYIKSKMQVAHEIFREMERYVKSAGGPLIVHCHQDVANWLYDEEGEILDRMETRLQQRIVVKVEPQFHVEQYELSKEH